MSDYPPERPTGRASVPGLRPSRPDEDPPGYGQQPPPPPAASGRATVGRASVSPPPPQDAAWDVMDSGNAGQPAPVAGRASVAGAAPVNLDEVKAVKGKRPIDPKKLKKRKRRKRLVALIVVILMLLGLGSIGGTYYFTTVPLPDQVALAQITRIFASDGKTMIGQIGEENRTVVDFAAISQPMKDAMIAAEDRSFYKNSGVDFKGMLRAFWNNVTGGDQQGASTITQQYARIAANLSQDSSYTRKAKEAAIAMKLDQQYSKDQILGFYLNTVDFGRGASGVQSAAQAYFGKDAAKLEYDEAAVIALQVKSPGGYYEPTENPERVRDRWVYVMDSLVETKAITPEKRAAYKWEDTFKKIGPPKLVGEFWKKPVYQVVKYVKEEMAELKRQGIAKSDLSTGGYSIYTSIDTGLQAEAEKAASSTEKGMPLNGQDPRIQAAMVATEPSSGRVLAYYGGPEGAGSDYAGYRRNSKGQIEGEGFHSPGSTAKVFVLAEAIKNNYRPDSIWDGTSPKDFPATQRTKARGNPVRNAGGTPGCGTACTLKDSTVQSLNTPFYALVEELKPDKVVGVMRDAGIRYMQPPQPRDGNAIIDMMQYQAADLAPSSFYYEVGIGQYPVTVLQHSAGFATFANHGVAVKQHFVTKVLDDKKKTIYDDKATNIPPSKKLMEPAQADVLTNILTGVKFDQAGGNLAGNRPYAAKTGTWELGGGDKAEYNGDVWIAGYTPQIATSVWVGSKKERVALVKGNKDGKNPGEKGFPGLGAQMYGSAVPGSIFKAFMDKAYEVNPAYKAIKATDKAAKFNPPKNIGDEDKKGNGVPKSSPPATPAIPGANGNGNGHGNGNGGGFCIPGITCETGGQEVVNPTPVPRPTGPATPPPARVEGAVGPLLDFRRTSG